jgi:hypothetical protein
MGSLNTIRRAQVPDYLPCGSQTFLTQSRLTATSLRDTILTLYEQGPVAQLGARLNRTEEAEGSNPSRSTLEPPIWGFLLCVILQMQRLIWGSATNNDFFCQEFFKLVKSPCLVQGDIRPNSFTTTLN